MTDQPTQFLDKNIVQQNIDLRRRRCPKCGGPVRLKPNMFHTHDVGYMSGLVCEPCNALWDDPDKSFLEAVAAVRKQETSEMFLNPHKHNPPPWAQELINELRFVQKRADEIEKALGIDKGLKAPANLHIGPFLLKAGISSNLLSDGTRHYYAAFKVTMPMPMSTIPTTEDIAAIAVAEEHFKRWLVGKEEDPLPTSKTEEV